MYTYVNIFNEGMIPWVGKNGPLFGYKVSPGLLSIIKRDSRITFEIVTSEDDVIRARNAYLAKKEKSGPIILNEVPAVNTDNIIPEDEVIIEVIKPGITENSEIISNETELDRVLDAIDEKTTFADPIIADKTDPEEPFKFYTDEELSTMTKAQMKKVLRGRGYLEGPYAGKYHDTVEMLKDKVRKTQTFKK